MTVADFSDILMDGDWRHQFLSANGARFHVAVAGPQNSKAPLVVLLHGFPQLWWSWREQMTALVAAGYRVAAMDLRGFGASDKPPLGYDLPNLTRDVAGVIRTLGGDQAVIVGHGLGGIIAWSMPTLQPAVTRAIGVLSAPHPARIHVSLPTSLDPQARKRMGMLVIPNLAEHKLRNSDLSSTVLQEWSPNVWDPKILDIYRTAMAVPSTAHTSLETMRWFMRNRLGSTHRRYLAAVSGAIQVPVLQIHGAGDRLFRASTAGVDSAALVSNLRYEVLSGVGHFLLDEASERVTTLLTGWLAEQVPADES